VLACEKYLMLELRRVKPEVIITMGATAAAWFDPTLKLAKDHGYPRQVTVERNLQELIKGAKLTKRESQEVSLPIRWSGLVVPMYHPAATLYNPALYPVLVEDFRAFNGRVEGGVELMETHYWLATNEEALEYVQV